MTNLELILTLCVAVAAVALAGGAVMARRLVRRLDRLDEAISEIQVRVSSLAGLEMAVEKKIASRLKQPGGSISPRLDANGNLAKLKIVGELAKRIGGKPYKTKTPSEKSVARELFRAKSNATGLSFSRLDIPQYYYCNAHKQIDILADWNQPYRDISNEVINSGTTHLIHDRLFTLWQAVRNVAASPAPILEVGVWRGGSSRFLAEARQHFGKAGKLYSCDTFIGPVAVTDGLDGVRKAVGFDDVDFDDVRRMLSAYPDVEIIRGPIEETAHRIPDETIAMIHLDVDLYAPTKFVLENFAHRLEPFGVIVVDDYGIASCPGVKQAVDEFMAANAEVQLFHILTGQAVLVRAAAEASAVATVAPRSDDLSGQRTPRQALST